MTITIDLPQVGESVVEGIIGQWLKSPGDRIEKYDPLVEVITDKVTMEVPSPVNGVLTRIIAEEGETVPMGAPIAEMETDEELPAPSPSSPQAASSPGQNVDTIGYLMTDVTPVGPTGGGMDDPAAASAPAGRRAPPPAPPPPASAAPKEERSRYSPAVRRLATELNVDLTRVTGTGVGGRITRDDVAGFAEGRGAAQPAAPARQDADEETVALSPVRRIIAEHMTRSANDIPAAWSIVEVDVSDLVALRQGMKDEFRAREGADLTYLPFVIKAVVESLREHPYLNSAWGGDKIVLKKRINVGVAVAGADGLVVPVIHDATTMSVAELAKAGRDLTNRAREGKLSLADVQGGTFTVNNTGALGSVMSQPIINHPQAAILTTEAIQKRPVVRHDAIAIRSMVNVCLTFDHRIVDGAQAAAFLQSVKDRLEAMGPDTAVY
ncbi:MAG: 2-oxo acid dehydrogenase subunit E2 [Dehalococcoidia bacterium]|nr:2-oxo acid dehydrogenase subunit E2 [Dehalococcoidia bacterium]